VFITLLSCHSQLNNSETTLVSDSVINSLESKITLKNIFEKIKIPLLKQKDEKRLWILPALAWNNYDKTQIGLIIGAQKEGVYNFLAVPMYGIGSQNLTGILDFNAHLNSKSVKNFGQIGIQAKRFSYLLFPEDLSYNKISPFINIDPKLNLKGKLSIYFRHQSIWQEYILAGRKTEYFNLNLFGAQHLLENKNFGIQTNMDVLFGNQFATFSIKSDLALKYKKRKGNGFYAKAYAGTFLYNNRLNTNINAPLPVFQLSGAANSGIYWLQKDFAFDDFYLDRNGVDNFFQRQVAPSEGGFKSLTSVGNSNSFLFAVNLKSDLLLPYKFKRILNIQPFLNFASAKNRNTKAEIFVEGGMSLGFWDEVLSFHIPFATTNNIKLNQSTVYGIEKGEWTKRVTFSLDLMALKRKVLAD
jgi:hypothetical protein